MIADTSLLINSPVFRGLGPEELEQLLGEVLFQVKHYNKDVMIAQMGQEMESLNILLKGSVRGEMMDYSGKTLKIEDIEAPRPLASAFLFGNMRKFPVTVITNTQVDMMVIPKNEFIRLMQKSQVILTNYLNTISSRTQFLSQKLHFLSFKTIREKIAHFLLQQAGIRYSSVELNNTQQQLADLFGVTRPSLARVLGDMQKEGLISIERKTVKIIDREGLNNLLRES